MGNPKQIALCCSGMFVSGLKPWFALGNPKKPGKGTLKQDIHRWGSIRVWCVKGQRVALYKKPGSLKTRKPIFWVPTRTSAWLCHPLQWKLIGRPLGFAISSLFRASHLVALTRCVGMPFGARFVGSSEPFSKSRVGCSARIDFVPSGSGGFVQKLGLRSRTKLPVQMA